MSPRARACVREIRHKNNRFLRRLRLNEIWRLRLLMWSRLRYYLLLQVTAGLDRTRALCTAATPRLGFGLNLMTNRGIKYSGLKAGNL